MFKIGDLVVAKEKAPYDITTNQASLCVNSITDNEIIGVKVLEHKDHRYKCYIGENYEVETKYFSMKIVNQIKEI